MGMTAEVCAQVFERFFTAKLIVQAKPLTVERSS
jgi:hypothetical protein